MFVFNVCIGPWHIGVLLETLRGFKLVNNELQILFQNQNNSVQNNNTFPILKNISDIVNSMNTIQELIEIVLPKEFVDGKISLCELPKKLDEPGFLNPM